MLYKKHLGYSDSYDRSAKIIKTDTEYVLRWRFKHTWYPSQMRDATGTITVPEWERYELEWIFLGSEYEE